MLTFTSEHVFHHHQMKALKGQAYESILWTVDSSANGNRFTAIQRLSEIVCALGVKIADGRDKFFRIAVRSS